MARGGTDSDSEERCGSNSRYHLTTRDCCIIVTPQGILLILFVTVRGAQPLLPERTKATANEDFSHKMIK
jgi:hypothetical protein